MQHAIPKVSHLSTNIYMKRIVCSFVLVLSLFSAHAQSQVTREEMQVLVQRVDSLEHELSYLKLSNDLIELNNNLTTFINEVKTEALEIRLNAYVGLIGVELGAAYERNYEANVERMAAIYEHIEAVKLSFTVETITKPYTESELRLLTSHYNTLDKAYETLDRAMDMLRHVVNMYNEEL